MKGRKVPLSAHFLDLSDYGRPLALWLARRVAPFPVSPHLFTLLHALVGLVAALFLAGGSRSGALWAGLLLPLKSTLDAVDGSLARLRNRPTRTGRFLDSDLDFLVNLALLWGIAHGHGAPLWLVLAAFLAMELQGSLYHHLYVAYRHRTGGDTSAHSRESAAAYPYENPRVVRFLFRLYRIFYGWQDELILRFLDRMAPGWPKRLTPRLMSLVSLLGLGAQLALLGFFCILGRPVWGLWALFLPWSGLALGVGWVLRGSTWRRRS